MVEILLGIFIVSLIFAYRVDLKSYVSRYGKSGQYVFYIIFIVAIILFILKKLLF